MAEFKFEKFDTPIPNNVTIKNGGLIFSARLFDQLDWWNKRVDFWLDKGNKALLFKLSPDQEHTGTKKYHHNSYRICTIPQIRASKLLRVLEVKDGKYPYILTADGVVVKYGEPING